MEYSAETNRRPPGLNTAAPGLPWRVVGAAVPGASHLRQDMPCQDAQSSRVLPSGELLVVVADGAGSARCSAQGAARAVETALAVLTASLEIARPVGPAGWEQLARSAVATARQAVLQLADESQESPREFACTLTCVVAAPGHLLAAQIGDGAVVAMDEDGALFSVLRLQRGEYANETHFITQDDALSQVFIHYTQSSPRALAVMSDGLIRLALKMPSQEPHEPFFQPLFRFASSLDNLSDGRKQMMAFLGSERVNQRTDDDKSLVLAVRIEPAAGESHPENGSAR